MANLFDELAETGLPHSTIMSAIGFGLSEVSTRPIGLYVDVDGSPAGATVVLHEDLLWADVKVEALRYLSLIVPAE